MTATCRIVSATMAAKRAMTAMINGRTQYWLAIIDGTTSWSGAETAETSDNSASLGNFWNAVATTQHAEDAFYSVNWVSGSGWNRGRVAKTTGETMPTPVIVGHTIYAMTGTGHLDAFALPTGKKKWSLVLHGFDGMSNPQVVGHILYTVTTVYHQSFPAKPSTVWAIDLLSHHILWHRVLPVVSGLGDNTPAISGSDLVIAGISHANTAVSP